MRWKPRYAQFERATWLRPISESPQRPRLPARMRISRTWSRVPVPRDLSSRESSIALQLR
jgi:hypothetical protein